MYNHYTHLYFIKVTILWVCQILRKGV